MIKQITISRYGKIMGLSDNGELYELINDQWSHVCASPDDREKPYFQGEWKKRNDGR